jgi:hypothetical protein
MSRTETNAAKQGILECVVIGRALLNTEFIPNPDAASIDA